MGQEAWEVVVAELTATSATTTGKMMGMPCLKIGSKMYAGLWGEDMVFKLGGDAHARALALGGAKLFDPSERDRPMREWVQVPAEHAGQWLHLGREALGYVGGGAT